MKEFEEFKVALAKYREKKNDLFTTLKAELSNPPTFTKDIMIRRYTAACIDKELYVMDLADALMEDACKTAKALGKAEDQRRYGEDTATEETSEAAYRAAEAAYEEAKVAPARMFSDPETLGWAKDHFLRRLPNQNAGFALSTYQIALRDGVSAFDQALKKYTGAYDHNETYNRLKRKESDPYKGAGLISLQKCVSIELEKLRFSGKTYQHIHSTLVNKHLDKNYGNLSAEEAADLKKEATDKAQKLDEQLVRLRHGNKEKDLQTLHALITKYRATPPALKNIVSTTKRSKTTRLWHNFTSGGAKGMVDRMTRTRPIPTPVPRDPGKGRGSAPHIMHS